LKFDVYDADSPDSDDYMGYVEFALGDLYNNANRRLELNIKSGNPGKGRSIIRDFSKALCQLLTVVYLYYFRRWIHHCYRFGVKTRKEVIVEDYTIRSLVYPCRSLQSGLK